jgi:O-antigen/teichoic acid export membrane protein
MAFMPILSVVILPRISRLVKSNINAARHETLLYLVCSMSIAFWMAPVVILESDEIILFIYGANYASAGVVLRIMCLVTIFQTASYCYGGNLVSFKKDWVLLFATLGSGIASIAGGALLVTRFGVIGAAWVMVGINLVGFIIPLPAYRTTIGTFGFEAWKLPLLGGITVVCVGLILQQTDLTVWIRGPIEVLVYMPFGLRSIRPVLAALKGSRDLYE